MSVPRMRLIHETNPRKYFPALYLLAERGQVEMVGAHRYSVVKEWLRAGLIDKTPFVARSRNALGDLWFRLTSWRCRGEVIVMGFAPWDWRLLFYRHLARHNQILYHTSWHDWRLGATPRQPRPAFLRRWMSQQWRAFLHHPNLRIVAVTPAVAASVQEELGVKATVIPHAVPKVFFEAGRNRPPCLQQGLRLLFVGEISKKKGIVLLLDMMARLGPKGVSLTVVGNGPLRGEVEKAEVTVTALGHISDRSKMAQVMSAHDVLVMPSQRTGAWEELFGIVIVEALAAGMVVLASDHVGPHGILAPADGVGLFDEANLAGMEALISCLAEDGGALKRMAAIQAVIPKSFALPAVAYKWSLKIAS